MPDISNVETSPCTADVIFHLRQLSRMVGPEVGLGVVIGLGVVVVGLVCLYSLHRSIPPRVGLSSDMQGQSWSACSSHAFSSIHIVVKYPPMVLSIMHGSFLSLHCRLQSEYVKYEVLDIMIVHISSRIIGN